jgi:hypothetical protein
MKGKLTISLIIAIIAIGGVLVTGAIILLNQDFLEKKDSGALSLEEVVQKALNSINQNLLGGETIASLVESEELNGVIKMRLKIEGEELDTYLTRDGKLFFPQAINLEDLTTVPNLEDEGSQITPSSEELEKFVECLKDADFVIYGANWCGYTKQLVTMLGGWDMVKPIYVECTENEELCQEKGVGGYPTILIQGEEYQGGRTFEEFGAATDCQVPSGAESMSGDSSTGGCQ